MLSMSSTTKSLVSVRIYNSVNKMIVFHACWIGERRINYLCVLSKLSMNAALKSM